MKLKYLFPLFAILLLFSCAEDPLVDPVVMEPDPEVITICDTERYTSPIFEELDSMTVMYAEKNLPTAHPNDLFMDIYMPAAGTDTLTKRPVMIWAFGGAFITGDRTQTHFLARESARLGYVSASIDYRILASIFPLPDSTIMMNTAVKAGADMKAAVRHFKMSADLGNDMNIDPDQIYIGGISAGAITALFAGGVDESDIDDEFLSGLIANNGGIGGNTGSAENQSYDHTVKGIVSLSGAVYKLDFLDATDPPIFSVHGDADEVVPYTMGMPNVLIPIDFNLFGSKAIFDRCQEIGLRNDLVTIDGGGHTDIYTDAQYAQTREDFFALGFQFLKDEICK